MYKVKPIDDRTSFDLRDVKLPDTLYEMAPIYGQSFVTPVTEKQQFATDGDQSKSLSTATSQIENSLDQQNTRLSNLSLNEPRRLILHLTVTSKLIDYLTKLKSAQINKLDICVFKHSSFSNSNAEQQLVSWYSLNTGSMIVGKTNRSAFLLQIVVKPENSEQAYLFVANANERHEGEEKIITVLNSFFT